MEQKTILNPIQRKFLDLAVLEPYLLKNYYWTGGTVLAEFYLRHRKSEDIDFNYYPFPRINLGQKWQGLAKDKFSLDWLINLADAKFDWHSDYR